MRRPAGSAPTPFSPLALSPSVFFDPSQTGGLFQDAAATLAVTADSQPVGLWQDLSPNGHDLSQAVSAARPTYRTDGTAHWIEADGVDDGLLTAAVFDVKNPVTMVLGYQMLSNSGTARVNIAEISKTSTNGMSVGVRPNIDRLQYYSRMAQQGVSATNVASPSIWGDHEKHVVTVQAVAGHVTARLDGAVVIDTAQNLTTQSVAAQPLRVGLGKVTGSIPGAFRLFGLQVWAAEAALPNATQVSDLEAWLASRMGVSI
ncbi:hypothetical protein MUY35_06210 [Aliiroseovarius sp. S1339]|uniref:hypothetical protein n=1 Tax=Aliiroseovarius sp. S1339 TaxID=2936990 RepID=UPI0020BEB06E|nr:hypothetical protein [Aliiroseovarius sp. S1339]MCK8463440.1 hypothetical protein [Aliiroseovarius sp. S1339]